MLSLLVDAPVVLGVPLTMAVALLMGARWGVVAAALAAGTSALLGAAWPMHAAPFAALGSALLLVRGVAPTLAAALLVPAPLAGMWLARGGFEPADAAFAALAGSASAVCALLALVLPPLRRRAHVRLPRLRTAHWVFVSLVGPPSFMALVLVGEREGHAGAALAAGGMVLAAHAAALLASARLTASLRRAAEWTEAERVSSTRALVELARASVPAETWRVLLRGKRALDSALRAKQAADARLAAALEKQGALQGALDAAEKKLHAATSALKSMRQAYERLRGRWDALVEHAPDAVLLADRRGTIRYANRAAAAALKHERKSLIGAPVGSLVPAGELGHPLQLDLAVKAPGELTSSTEEAKILCGDGKARRMTVRIAEFALGESRGFALRLSTAAPPKAGARAEADASHVFRDETIAAMTHELRTPLHGLIATLDMLRDENLSETAMHQLAVAKASARTLLNLANDVLDIGRLDRGHFSLAAKPFSLETLLRETIEEFQAQAQAKGLQLSLAARGPFPRTFVGDRQRIKQVLSNLMTNAIKFTSEGSVTVEARFEAGTIVIDVADTGSGIPDDMHETIFQPFVQAPNAAHKPGTGLGLSISRGLCQAMGGGLTLVRSDLTGTLFRVELRLEASDAEAPEESSNRVFMNPTGKILVVEDHQINQFVVKSMLASLNCPATIASSGEEALERLARERFDLILMDCRMPGLDGQETTRRARQHLKIETPIVAMTANAGVEEREACIAAGMNDFLPKPFGRSALHEVLCRWLQPDASAKAAAKRGARRPALDEGVFDELWESLRWEAKAMRQISESFRQTVQRTLDALEHERGEDLRRQLHTLAGTAGMIGAAEVRQIAAQLEDAVKGGGSVADLDERRRALAAAGEAFQDAFERRLRSRDD